ncbi:MAG: lytic transglycosylase domain-containing protein [Desulfuromonadales bacterium]|jgi:soluble lytic murein transglycosylase|nr:lytic transglycosylase domain-containing protein [Desulfuromonadales bacterium]MDH3867850.1 lytic transglycosylase domain-containing protein [Desulfuromonadales bacterium]MDH3959755.1 lytic transglycosylase domain-containing protein [Desulfuromonadales bacterium]MDH4025446.1 lytic transglycosylase domain-containing protein [Desulfuromonadales bacterium]
MVLVRNIAFIVVLLMSLFVVIPPADADIYRYVDASGRVHFTDTPTHGRYDMYMKEEAPVKASNRSYLDIIRRHATSYQLEEALVKAVIKVESDYQPRIVSRKGAQGLMQLIPQTAKDLKVSNPFDPYENIRGGSEYLRMMLDLFNNDVELALAAYNSGPSTVKRYGGIPPYDETQKYVKKVKRYLDYYRRVGDTLL